MKWTETNERKRNHETIEKRNEIKGKPTKTKNNNK